MAKYKEIQRSLKQNIIDVLLTLQNKDLSYRSHIAVKGSIAVTIDHKKLFVIRIQETFAKNNCSSDHQEVVLSQLRKKKLKNSTICSLDDRDYIAVPESVDSHQNEKSNSLLPSVQNGLSIVEKGTLEAAQTLASVEGESDNVDAEDYSAEVKSEPLFEPVVHIQADKPDTKEYGRVKAEPFRSKRRSDEPKKHGKASRRNPRRQSKSIQERNESCLQCSGCHKFFPSKEVKAQHVCNRKSHSIWECDKCGKKWKSRIALSQHKKACCLPDEKKCETMCKCTSCGEGFTSQRLLKTHLKNQPDCDIRGREITQALYCFICHMPFQNRHSLDKHEIANHLPDEGHPFKCTLCGAKFGCSAHLKRHEKSHSDKQTFLDYVCKECGMKFEREASLKKHQTTHLPRQKLYSCVYCDELFCTQYEMRIHKEEMHEDDDRKYLCLVCKEFFETQEEKNQHSCAENRKMEEMESFPFKCTVCGCSYDSETNLLLHQASGDNCLALRTGDYHVPYYCMECNIDYLDEVSFHSHIHVDRPRCGSSIERCQHCGLVCESSETLTKHRNTFHQQRGKNLFHCPVCQQIHKTRSSLLTHITTHRDLISLTDEGNSSNDPDPKHSQSKSKNMLHTKRSDSFPCKTCRATFKSQDEVYCHIEMTHLVKHMTYVCGLCSSSFTELNDLRDHENQTHDSLPPFACFICDSRFASQNLLDEHLNGAECKTCHTKFLAHCQLHYHSNGLEMAKRKQEIPYCIPCGKSFASHVSLMLHERRSHQPADGHPFKCKDCGRRFGNMTHLRRHMMIHTNAKPYLCDHCGKSFRSERSRSIHDKLFHHDGESHRFQCDICKKKFGSQQNLDRHELVHTGFKPHLCVTCGRRFKSKETLRDHDKRVHQGKFEFSCKTCGHGFKTEFKLQLHLLMHQQYSDYKCQRCNDKCDSMAELMAHHSKKHPDFVSEKKMQCGICGARYPDTNQLQHHQSSHLPTKMFRCEFCNATFQHKTSLFRHRNRRCPSRKDATKQPQKTKSPRTRIKSAKKRVDPEPVDQREQEVVLRELQPVPVTTSTETVATGNDIPIVLHSLQDSVPSSYGQMPIEVPVPHHHHQNISSSLPWEPHLMHHPQQPQLQHQQSMMHPFHSMPAYRHPTHPPPPPPHPYTINQQFPALQLPRQPHLQPR